jgi:tetratricopeptide (TPR) repeat protein
MSGDRPPGWVERLSEAVRHHEKDRTSALRSIPRYEIRGELGRGGMGVVYRAWDPQLGREVALKVLQAAPDDAAEAHERFLREAQLSARLSHPNIVAVYDIGEWEGRTYLAMQLVDGATLEKAALDLRTALTAVRDAARALDYAHAHGIVHRDVKPSNLMLDRQGRLFVTDFGLARRNDVPTKITLTGVVIGTPSYMSPEQARGGATDGRSDVYSLGSTMYELVTGRTPFTGGDAMSVLLAQILKEPAPPRFHNEGLPKEVETIVLKAMEKDPGKRYATAGAMADDLQRFLDGQAIQARRPSPAARLGRRIARHPWRAVAAAALLGLLAAAGVILRDYRAAARQMDQGRAEPDLERKIAFYERAARWFAEAEAALPDLRHQLATRRAEEKEKELQPLLSLAGAWARINQEFDRCRTLLRERNLAAARAAVQAVADETPEPYRSETAFTETLRTLRSDLLKLDFEEGLALLARRQGPAEFRELYGRLAGETFSGLPDRNSALAAAALAFGKSLARRGAFPDAVEWLTRAEERGATDLELYEQRGLARVALGDWAGAGRDREEFGRRRPLGTPFPPGFAPLFFRGGQEAARAGRWEEAVRSLAEALALDPGHAQGLHDHGLARFRAHGLAKEALEDLERALGRDAALKPSPEYAEVLLAFVRERGPRDAAEALRVSGRLAPRLRGDLSKVHLERARLRFALRDYAGTLEDGARAGGGPDAWRLRGQAAVLLVRTGTRDEKRLREAVDAFDRAARLQPDDARTLYWRGTARHLLGGREALDAAAEDFRACLAAGVAVADSGLQLARIHLDAGRWKDAAEASGRALEGKDLSADERLALLGEHQGVPAADLARRLRRDAFFARARGGFESGDFEACARDATEALGIDRAFAAALFLRGYARHRQRDYDGAADDFGEVLRLSPEDVEAYVGRGTARTYKREFDLAIQDYSAAIRLNPRSAEAYAGRGAAKVGKDDLDGARADYRKALEVAPPDWPHRAAVEEKLKKL